MRVVVVGGGASGTLAALHLARSGAGRPLELHLAEPGPLGRGVAYSTGNHQHRLNVPAAGMSALPGEPGHFVDWLRAHHDPAFPAGGFAPRAVFGTYLASTLSRHLDRQHDRAGGLRWTRHRARAVDLRRHGRGAAVTLAGGRVLEADAVVLALGHGPAATAWVPPGLRGSPRFVADPWSSAGLPPMPAGSDVLLVGTGLTMLDLAISYGHTRIHAVSRHGRLPLAHVADPPAPAPAQLPDVPDGPVTAASLRRLVFGRIRDLDGDWRTAVDGLRPITQQLWSRLDPDGRRQVLAHAGRWERVRHRTAPELGAWLAQRHQDGRLTVRAAAVTEAGDSGDSVLAGLSDGTQVRAGLVVNCTGRASILGSDDPLVSGLLARGSVRPDPLGLGFATHPDGRLVSADDLPAWTLGQPRRGQLWESTAIPEIRDQAADLAGAILAPIRPVRAGTREVA